MLLGVLAACFCPKTYETEYGGGTVTLTIERTTADTGLSGAWTAQGSAPVDADTGPQPGALVWTDDQDEAHGYACFDLGSYPCGAVAACATWEDDVARSAVMDADATELGKDYSTVEPPGAIAEGTTTMTGMDAGSCGLLDLGFTWSFDVSTATKVSQYRGCLD